MAAKLSIFNASRSQWGPGELSKYLAEIHPLFEQKMGAAYKNVRVAWLNIDEDASGKLDHQEFMTLFTKFNIILRPDQKKRLFELFDPKGTGEVVYDRFNEVIGQVSNCIIHVLTILNDFLHQILFAEVGGYLNSKLSKSEEPHLKKHGHIPSLQKNLWNNRWRQETCTPEPNAPDRAAITRVMEGKYMMEQPGTLPKGLVQRPKQYRGVGPQNIQEMDPTFGCTIMDSVLKGRYFGARPAGFGPKKVNKRPVVGQNMQRLNEYSSALNSARSAAAAPAAPDHKRPNALSPRNTYNAKGRITPQTMGDLHTATGVTAQLPTSLLQFLKSANPMQKEQFKALSLHIKAGLTPRAPDAASSARIQNAESYLSHAAARPPLPSGSQSARTPRTRNFVDISAPAPENHNVQKSVFKSSWASPRVVAK